MPTSSLRRQLVGQSPLAWAFPASYRPQMPLIGPWSYEALGEDLAMSGTNWASQTYASANRAHGYMFCTAEPLLVVKVWWVNGATATTDSADVAVYSEDGATRHVAAGSTAIAGASVVQEVDVTDTLLLPNRYWCVYNQNGVTATPTANNASAAVVLRGMGWAQFAGAVPLGSSFTPAALTAGTVCPLFGIAFRTQVA